jgi:hypothetical protein
MPVKRELTEDSEDFSDGNGDNYSPSPKVPKRGVKREMSEKTDEYHDADDTIPPPKSSKKTPQKPKVTPKKAKVTPSSSSSQSGSQGTSPDRKGSPKSKLGEFIIECGMKSFSKAEAQVLVSCQLTSLESANSADIA